MILYSATPSSANFLYAQGIVHAAPATTSTLLAFTQHYQMILHNARGHTQALHKLKKCPDMKLQIFFDTSSKNL